MLNSIPTIDEQGTAIIMFIPLLLIASLALTSLPQGWVSDLIKGAPMHTEVEEW
jgi:hypothetical protein